ncbi:OmpA family protein [Steroidobacter sp. S1-65]|uniref:OmpA family protein n=1 Tax=Steroidobacter gossypii TaxID=2805490 RepID=A0ABS1WVK7_9GAMM|nr:OmpA family protein [Steroidobacter gossypii]MBM0104993.1 OmpA family protein [Steroidobacter gossypii]
MSLNKQIVLTVAVAAVLSACSATPERNETLERARTLVSQVESSPRAGIAAADIANARTSLDAADRLAESKTRVSDMEFEATNAALSAQIANEKILTAEAKEAVANGTAQRQAVLIKARERDVQKSTDQADEARRQATASQARADSLETELADLKLKKTERGLVLTLGDVMFDTGQSTLKPGAYATLDRLATALQQQTQRKVLIEGHTDNVGSSDNNQGLSERRAQSVQMGLTHRGVERSQITALGKGENFPIAGNDTADGRQSNRRVELIFTDAPARIAADPGP